MTRWIVWSAVLICMAAASTLASRARNTSNLFYHACCAVGSHGTFIVAQFIGVDLIVEIVRTKSWTLAAAGFLVYVSASTSGSVLSHFISMRYLEKGSRRVGSYSEAK